MASDYARIEQAIRYLVDQAHEQPTLEDLAVHLRLSPFHLQRLFHRWAGVTPKDFLQVITLRRAKEALTKKASLLATSLAVGLSGSGRLHDLFITHEAMTPGEFKTGGLGVTIDYGVHETPLGSTLIATSPRGICGISFVDGEERDVALELKRRWPEARLRKNPRGTRHVAEELRRRMLGAPRERLHVVLRGTPFQVKVWQALVEIPEGQVVTYQGIAAVAGASGAARAVGTALAQNPLAYLIPCHRVLRATGEVGEYRWGIPRKHALLALEGLRTTGATRGSRASARGLRQR